MQGWAGAWSELSGASQGDQGYWTMIWGRHCHLGELLQGDGRKCRRCCVVTDRLFWVKGPFRAGGT